MKKFISFAFAALLILSTLVGCENKSSGMGNSETQTEGETQNGTHETSKDNTSANSSNSDFSYTQNTNGIVRITSYTGELDSVVIPSEINNQTVSEIGENAFKDNKTIKKIVIPDTVTIIGNSAFSNCSNLTHVALPSNLKSIGVTAFKECSSLSYIELPQSLSDIGKSAFEGCIALTSIHIYSNNFDGGHGGEFLRSGLETVTFEYGVKNIPAYAFANTKLTSITLPNSLERIGREAFSYCKSLNNIVLNEGLISIGDGAFTNTGLAEIIIPTTVSNITEFAFDNTPMLAKVIFQGNAPQEYIYPKEVMPIDPVNTNYTIYFYNTSSGFDSPNWNGYPAIEIKK